MQALCHGKVALCLGRVCGPAASELFPTRQTLKNKLYFKACRALSRCDLLRPHETYDRERTNQYFMEERCYALRKSQTWWVQLQTKCCLQQYKQIMQYETTIRNRADTSDHRVHKLNQNFGRVYLSFFSFSPLVFLSQSEQSPIRKRILSFSSCFSSSKSLFIDKVEECSRSCLSFFGYLLLCS